MFERRRQAASLVSLLVVTLLFLWACSSGDHEVALVTTSGGAGSEEISGNVPRANSEGGSPALFPGLRQSGATVLSGDSGSAGDAGFVTPDPVELPPIAETGGTTTLPPFGSAGGTSAGGAPSFAGSPATAAGSPGSAGAGSSTGAAGSPAVIEIACSAEQSTSGGTFLPCDVSSAMYACRNCHSNPPIKGVQHAYVTYADVKPRAAQIHDLVKSGVMPWPPYKLSDQQKAIVLDWLGKDGTCAIGAAQSCQ
jgi:hypothetical protein